MIRTQSRREQTSQREVIRTLQPGDKTPGPKDRTSLPKAGAKSEDGATYCTHSAKFSIRPICNVVLPGAPQPALSEVEGSDYSDVGATLNRSWPIRHSKVFERCRNSFGTKDDARYFLPYIQTYNFQVAL